MNKFLDLLVESKSLLEKCEERHWSEKINEVIKKINNGSDFHEKEIRSWFGSMGSINDLYLTKHNGHKIEPDQEDVVNARFRKLLDKLFSEVK